jgi:hypothetical protein
MAIASATLTPFGEVELTFPFNRELVDDLKTEIPKQHRSFDGETKAWRVMGMYRETAINLLLEHFPRAEVPNDQPRRRPALAARTEKPPATQRPPLPPLDVAPTAEPDDPERDHLVACIRCPMCGKRHDQPVRVVASPSLAVAKQERPPAELIHVCPGCSTLGACYRYPGRIGGDVRERGSPRRRRRARFDTRPTPAMARLSTVRRGVVPSDPRPGILPRGGGRWMEGADQPADPRADIRSAASPRHP